METDLQKPESHFKNHIPHNSIYILPSLFILQYTSSEFSIFAVLLLTVRAVHSADATHTIPFYMETIISTERNAKAITLAAINAEAAKSPEFKAQIEAMKVSVEAAKSASASRRESPFQDGVFLKLHSTVFEDSVGVKFFKRTDGSVASVYSILVDISSDKEGTQLLRVAEPIYGTMLRKTDEERFDTDLKIVIPYEEGSLNLDPKVKAAQTLEELFEAFKAYTGGMMKIVSKAYAGINRRGEKARLHVVSLVKA